MKIFKHSDADFEATLKSVINRANLDLETHDIVVREILGQVKERGDVALLEYTHRFDQYDLPLEQIKVARSEIDEAFTKVDNKEIDALKRAAKNIREFHDYQSQESWEYEKNGVFSS